HGKRVSVRLEALHKNPVDGDRRTHLCSRIFCRRGNRDAAIAAASVEVVHAQAGYRDLIFAPGEALVRTDVERGTGQRVHGLRVARIEANLWFEALRWQSQNAARLPMIAGVARSMDGPVACVA